MLTSRLIFAGINNVKTTDEAHAVAVGRLSNASETLCSVFPAQYVRPDVIEVGIAFFLEASSGENIVDRAVRLNRLLGGGIHSVETNDYGNEAYCFYTSCRGSADEIAVAWQTYIKRYWDGSFVDCIIHDTGKNSCYVSGTINRRHIKGETEAERIRCIANWKQRIEVLFEVLKSKGRPHFIPTRCTNLD